jgi:Fur family ferric uptake transcriptional regulator
MKEPQSVFAEFLSRRKLKMTPQRRLILDAFLAAEGHLASEELYEMVKRQDKSIGQATVYRTLKLFSESGLAKEVHFGDGVTRYERKYGAGHHDHLICERCGVNVEVLDERIEALQEDLAKRHGFELTGHKMYLYGICSRCRKAR